MRTLTGQGYYLVAADGGVFNFRDARLFGSQTSSALNAPMIAVAVAVDQTGKGYWLVGADGVVFRFGDAPLQESLPGAGLQLRAPIIGAVNDS